MPVTTRKGGVFPESEPPKKPIQPQGPRAFKGGMVPESVLEDSASGQRTPSSPPVVLDNPVTKQKVTVQQMPASGPRPSPRPSPRPAAPAPSAPSAEVKADPFQEYSGWDLLGLQMDTKDPLRQQEIRKHPITGEVVLVPVGKFKEEGATPTLVVDSLPQPDAFAAPSPAPVSAEAADTAAPATEILDQA